MLITEENASERERRYLKIECSSEDMYFLDSDYFFHSALKNMFFLVDFGKIHYYSFEKLEKPRGNTMKVIASLSNIKIKDIVINKEEGFLIALSQGTFHMKFKIMKIDGDIYIIVREEIAYLVPKTISICFYSVNTSFDRLDCLGKGKKLKKITTIFSFRSKK